MTETKTKQRWNRKGFLARDWIMALILFTGVVALSTLMVAQQATDYDNLDIIDEDILEDFGNLQQTTSVAKEAFDVTNDKDALTITGSFSILFQSAFSVIALIFNSIAIATSQLASFGEFIGLPTAVSNLIFPIIISLITVVLVFVIISTTTRRDFAILPPIALPPITPSPMMGLVRII